MLHQKQKPSCPLQTNQGPLGLNQSQWCDVWIKPPEDRYDTGVKLSLFSLSHFNWEHLKKHIFIYTGIYQRKSQIIKVIATQICLVIENSKIIPSIQFMIYIILCTLHSNFCELVPELGLGMHVPYIIYMQACKPAGWIHVINLLTSGIFTVNTMLTY